MKASLAVKTKYTLIQTNMLLTHHMARFEEDDTNDRRIENRLGRSGIDFMFYFFPALVPSVFSSFLFRLSHSIRPIPIYFGRFSLCIVDSSTRFVDVSNKFKWMLPH